MSIATELTALAEKLRVWHAAEQEKTVPEDFPFFRLPAAPGFCILEPQATNRRKP